MHFETITIPYLKLDETSDFIAINDNKVIILISKYLTLEKCSPIDFLQL